MFITGFAAVALHPSSNAPKQAKVLSKPFHLREIVQEVEPHGRGLTSRLASRGAGGRYSTAPRWPSGRVAQRESTTLTS